MSKAVVWMRRRKGGRREVTPIPVTVVGRTPAGAFIVEYTRRFRRIRRVVAAKNIRPLIEFKAEGPAA